MIKKRAESFEVYLFYLIVFLHLTPLFFGSAFPSFDGAAHIHNTNAFNQLIFGDNAHLKEFFKFNDLIVPNWTATALMGFFDIFFSTLVAEKVIIALYIILLPLTFRSLVKALRAENLYLTYLIFPFIHSQFLFMGFHNFNIALVLLFITLRFWVNKNDSSFKWRDLFILTLLLTFTFFSHLFVFGITLLSIALYSIFFYVIRENSDSFKDRLLELVKKGGMVLTAALLPLFLAILFLMYRPAVIGINYLSKEALWSGLRELKMLIAFNSEIESPRLFIILIVILSLLLISLYTRLNQIEFSKFFKIKKALFGADVWLFLSVILLVSYFKLPDSDGTVGYVSPRLALMAFLFLLIWLNLQSYSTRFKIIAAALTVSASLLLTKYYVTAVKNYNTYSNEILETENFISEGTVILPINFSQDWFIPHFSNYLGYRKSCVILENYEASSSLFPLEWNQSTFPNLKLDELSSAESKCAHWNINESNAIKKIDYIFILGDTATASPECKTELRSLLNNSYHKIHSTSRTSLYQLSSK